MARLFVGVPAPGTLELSGVRNALEQRGDNVKLVDPSLYHVTIAFLGETSEDRIDDIAAAMAAGGEGTPKHEGEAQGLGAFPSAQRASVVWTGVNGTQLEPMAKATRAALSDRGVGFDDRHDFHPHMTLARLRDKRDLRQLITPHEKTSFGSFPVEAIHLYESTLTPQGPVYDVRETVHLEA